MAQQYFTGTEWVDLPADGVLTVSNTEIETNGVRIRENNGGCTSTPVVQAIPINIYNTDTQSVMSCSDIATQLSGGALTFDGSDYASTAALEAAVQAFYAPYTLSYNGTTCKFDMTVGIPPTRIEVSNAVVAATIVGEFTATTFTLSANRELSETIIANDGSSGNLSGSAVIQITVDYGGSSCVVEYAQGSVLGSGSATQISGSLTLYNAFVNNTSSVAILNAANLNGAGVDIVVDKMQAAADFGLQGTNAVDMTLTVQAIDGASISDTGAANATSVLPVVSRGCWDNTTQDLTETVITGGYRYNPFPDIGGIYEVFPVGGSWSTSAIADGFFEYGDSNTKFEITNSSSYLENQTVRVSSYTTKGGATVNGPFTAFDLLTSPQSRMRLVLDAAGQNMPFNDMTDLPGTGGTAGAGYTNAISPASGDYYQSGYRRDDTGGLDDIVYDDMMDEVTCEITSGTNAGATFVIRVGDAFQYRY